MLNKDLNSKDAIMKDNNTTNKRVLGIIGSPRKSGNTEILIDELLLGAQQAGAQIEKVCLSV